MTLFAQKEAEAFLKTGLKEFRYDRETRLTPGARDVLTESGVKIVFGAGNAPSTSTASPAPATASGTGTAADLKLFNSPEATKLKQEICDIGRRIWMREYCDGNGGNISARLGPDRFLVTPTGASKGFMTPDMLSLVDGKGNQL